MPNIEYGQLTALEDMSPAELLGQEIANKAAIHSLHSTRPIDFNPDFVGPPLFTDLIGIRHSSESGNDHFEITCKDENSVSILIGDLDWDSINISWEQWIDIRREVDAVFSDMNRLKNTNKWFCHKPTDGTHEWGIGSCPSCGYRLIKVLKTGFLFCSNHESVCDYERELEEVL